MNALNAPVLSVSSGLVRGWENKKGEKDEEWESLLGKRDSEVLGAQESQ